MPERTEPAQPTGDFRVRPATRDDLPTIVRLLREDRIAEERESVVGSDDTRYRAAFDAISRDDNHTLLVAESRDRVIGTLQLSFLPNLTYEGGWRAQIEGVRIDPGVRGGGFGTRFIEDAVRRARERGCVLVQLTTDRRRPEALRFYEDLGFTDSHHGMKLRL